MLRGCTADNDANKAVVQVGPKKFMSKKKHFKFDLNLFFRKFSLEYRQYLTSLLGSGVLTSKLAKLSFVEIRINTFPQ